MTKDETILALNEIFREHASGIRGYIGQEPYKGDLFKLFVSSYGEGLAGDVIVHEMRERWPGEYRDGLPGSDLLHEVRQMWDEWRYTRDNLPKG